VHLGKCGMTHDDIEAEARQYDPSQLPLRQIGGVDRDVCDWVDDVRLMVHDKHIRNMADISMTIRAHEEVLTEESLEHVKTNLRRVLGRTVQQVHSRCEMILPEDRFPPAHGG
jgi:hypothetical protein